LSTDAPAAPRSVLCARQLNCRYGFNYLLATGAGRLRVIATHGPVVVSGLAVLGGATMGLLGYLAGREAPRRSDPRFLEP